MLGADGVETGLDVLHVVDVFDGALFAGGDDEALLAVHEGDLGDFLDGHEAEIVFGLGANVDEGAQAVVLAEVAAGIFVAGGAVFDFADGVESDKGRLAALAPKAEGFLGGADRARFTAVFMDDNFGLFAGGAKAIADEIDLGLDDSEIVLGAALQHEA